MSEEMLKGTIKAGDHVLVDMQDDQLEFKSEVMKEGILTGIPSDCYKPSGLVFLLSRREVLRKVYCSDSFGAFILS